MPAKPSIENLAILTKTRTHDDPDNTLDRFNWDVRFTVIDSRGTRVEHTGEAFFDITRADMLDRVKQYAKDFEAAEDARLLALNTPPVREFPGRYDATKNGLRELDPADYPAV